MNIWTLSMERINEPRYGIGAVAKLTGLNHHTIRVWERRYGAVVAERAPNGRRLYGPDDVEKLALLKRLTDEGLAIGQISGDSIDELRKRTENLAEIAKTPIPERIGVAILGDFLPGQVAENRLDLAPVEVLVSDSNSDRFDADLSAHEVDAIVLETPVLDSDVTARLSDYVKRSNAACGVIVYSFGRMQDVDLARDSRIAVLRAPVDLEELRAAVIRAYQPGARPGRKTAPEPAASSAGWDFSEPLAPRRFSSSQLATLARASTAIDCECPQHLAQLVGDLTAFEVYSANCANRDEDDAALHRYLHKTTAQARALIEIALERVAEAEGIRY